MPAQKELHFFNDNYEQGLGYYSDFFANATEKHKVVGEITPNYYHEHYALERIKSDLSNVKIIFILREPLSRAYSHYQLSITTRCKGLTFDQALKEVPPIKVLSMQGKHLDFLYSVFAKENVHVCLYDDLQNAPLTFYRNILEFLAVDNTKFIPEKLSQRVNRIIFPEAQEMIKKLGLGFLVESVKSTFIGSWIKAKYNGRGRESVKNDVSGYKNLFAEDIKLLEKLTNLDLSNWK